MAIFKCKMCGGTLEIQSGETVAVCDSCGTKQTLPKLSDERRANLYDRANHFRRSNEYDKALGIYEQILAEDRTDAEAYWSIVLCRYGVEYVEDPATHGRVPTVNRTQFTSILADEDYRAALEYADAYQRGVYEAEARAIDGIQKGILAVSNAEKPFDVFICYKDTDAGGRRTPDSVLANDLYHQLTQEGFAVFYARITLEDKLGQEYEPYIFAALNSAKVMVVLGTRPEYFSAVWVKNEWSRYLALIKGGANKVLIPAYKDMDPYDLPDEFSHLQAQDMGKLGFMQDLIRGIRKITDASAKTAAPQAAVQPAVNSAAPLLKRAFMFLEDGDWARADEFCEQALNIDPENALAYVGKLCAELKAHAEAELSNCAEPFDGNGNYKKALRFADAAQKAALTGYVAVINERNEQKRLYDAYLAACTRMKYATTAETYKLTIEAFNGLAGYRDVDERVAECRERAKQCAEQEEAARKDEIYAHAIEFLEREDDSAEDCEDAISLFASIPGWKDADEKIEECRQKIAALEAEQARAAEQARIEGEERKKKAEKSAVIIMVVAGLALAAVLLVTQVIVPAGHYKEAEALLAAGDYDGAIAAFTVLGDYKDAREQIDASHYQQAEALLAAEDYQNAIEAFGNLGAYKDASARAEAAKTRMMEIQYANAEGLLAAGKYADAAQAFGGITDFKDASERVQEAFYRYGETLLASDNYMAAVRAFTDAGDYKDASARILEAHYAQGEKLLSAENYAGAASAFKNADNYKDAKARMTQELTEVLASGDSFAAARILAATGEIKRARALFNFDNRISAGIGHTVGLKADGTVVAVGDNEDGQCNVSAWRDIVAVSAGWRHTVGLKADGTVVAVGYNEDGRCAVSGWTDIVAISAGEYHTVGLKEDGTVVATEYTGLEFYYDGQCAVQDWSDIIAVAAGSFCTVGLKADGTVIHTPAYHVRTGDWDNIVAITASKELADYYSHSIGLRADGTVAASQSSSDSYDDYGQSNVQDWRNILAVYTGYKSTFGLRADGTVAAVGFNKWGQCNVSGWTDIVAVSTRGSHTVGLRADGRVVAAGGDVGGVLGWDLW